MLFCTLLSTVSSLNWSKVVIRKTIASTVTATSKSSKSTSPSSKLSTVNLKSMIQLMIKILHLKTKTKSRWPSGHNSKLRCWFATVIWTKNLACTPLSRSPTHIRKIWKIWNLFLTKPTWGTLKSMGRKKAKRTLPSTPSSVLWKSTVSIATTMPPSRKTRSRFTTKIWF